MADNIREFPRSKVEPPGEPPYDAGMEARVANLEQFAGDAREKLARIETKLDNVDKEVGAFKWWMLATGATIILTMIATVIGTGIGIQQMTVSTFQAAASKEPVAPLQPTIIVNVPPAPQTPATKP